MKTFSLSRVVHATHATHATRAALTTLTTLALLAHAPVSLRAENLAITGGTVYTVSGAPLKNGVVLVRDGKIEAVGPAATTAIPAGYRTLTAAVVTPGLIDAHSTIGLSGILNQPHDQDQLEKSASFQPELRAIDAYNAQDPLVAWVRSLGVTTVNTGHSPGALASGQTMIVKTFGRTADEDVINPAAMTSVALGRNGLTAAEVVPGAGAPSAKAPGTRAKAVNGDLLFGNIDAVRPSIRPEARIQGYIIEGGTAPNVVPDRTVADFYIRYPDEVYLAQVVEFVDNAAKAAALSTGTKVKIDHYGKDVDGISLATLGELGFAYMKHLGATGVNPEPGKPQGFEETGSASRDIPGISITAQSSTFSNHTYEMDADNLKEIGHKGFTVDAQTMAAVLFDFATRADYRAAVKTEFDGIKALFGEYQAALKKVYTVPIVPDPKN